jgi:xanthine dehydrogenase YagR molybdenum-binding subunit
VGVDELADFARRRHRVTHGLEHLRGERQIEERVDQQGLLAVRHQTGITPAPGAVRLQISEAAVSEIVQSLGVLPFAHAKSVTAALSAETATDHRFGRFMTHNLADYHVPTNADVQAIDVIFVEERDEEINRIGIKGVGEIGIVGTAAAIANAIYHATGKRIRDLPITIDKLMRVVTRNVTMTCCEDLPPLPLAKKLHPLGFGR